MKLTKYLILLIVVISSITAKKSQSYSKNTSKINFSSLGRKALEKLTSTVGLDQCQGLNFSETVIQDFHEWMKTVGNVKDAISNEAKRKLNLVKEFFQNNIPSLEIISKAMEALKNVKTKITEGLSEIRKKIQEIALELNHKIDFVELKVDHALEDIKMEAHSTLSKVTGLFKSKDERSKESMANFFRKRAVDKRHARQNAELDQRHMLENFELQQKNILKELEEAERNEKKLEEEAARKVEIDANSLKRNQESFQGGVEQSIMEFNANEQLQSLFLRFQQSRFFATFKAAIDCKIEQYKSKKKSRKLRKGDDDDVDCGEVILGYIKYAFIILLIAGLVVLPIATIFWGSGTGILVTVGVLAVFLVLIPFIVIIASKIYQFFKESTLVQRLVGKELEKEDDEAVGMR